MKKIFPLIIALSALSVAGTAAFYSVFGLSKLFAGAQTQVIIMAGSLEFAKLVVASLLYQYWGKINKILRTYLTIACFVLMIITSGGIYGFLSGAYQSTATQSELLDKSLVILEHKQTRFGETKDDLILEKSQLNTTISELRTSLSNPTSVSYYSEDAQQVITTTSSSARRALQTELKSAITDRDNINLKLDAILDSITTTDMALLNKEISNEDERELGPLKYLAGITGWAMDRVVNLFLLLIIFVFDPLAIALVVTANFAFAQIRKEPEEVTAEPIKEQMEEVKLTYPDFIEKHYKKEPLEELKQRVKENQGKLKDKQKKLDTVNSKVTNDISKIDELEDKINYFSDILTNIDNKTKDKKKEEIDKEVPIEKEQLTKRERRELTTLSPNEAQALFNRLGKKAIGDYWENLYGDKK